MIRLMIMMIHLLLAVVEVVPRTPTTAATMTTAIQTFKCSAIMEPKDLVIRPEDEEGKNLWIRCAASMPSLAAEMFTNPVFDLSFGDTSNTGLYIVRGIGKCRQNYTRCESEFRIPGNALRQLLLSPAAAAAATIVDDVATTNNAGSSSSSSSSSALRKHREMIHPSIIKVTCDVADTSRRTRSPVRCTDSATIKVPRVLQYGESCSLAGNNDDSEVCGANMRCIGGKCHCRAGAIQTYAGHDRVICVQPAIIGQQCLVTKQCSENDPNSLCRFVADIGHKICQCQEGFILWPSSSSSSQGSSSAMVLCQKPDHQRRQEWNETTTADALESLPGEHRKSSFTNLGLAIFFIILFWILVVGFVVLRFAKNRYQQYKMEQDGQPSVKLPPPPPLRSDSPMDDVVEVEVKIFEDEQPELTDQRNRIDDSPEIIPNNSNSSFDFSNAKQSVV